MSNARLPIHVVDDDAGVLKALSRLLRSSGFEVFCYCSADEFIAQTDSTIPGCLVLDISMPGLNGLQLQEWLTRSGRAWPVIFVSGKSDIPISVRAMKAGAVDFLTKPVDEQDLLRAIDLGMERHAAMSAVQSEVHELRARWETLSPREREVLEHVVAGQMNKQVASDLGTVEKTIKVHRGRVMRKMGAASLPDLVRMAGRLGIGTRERAS